MGPRFLAPPPPAAVPEDGDEALPPGAGAGGGAGRVGLAAGACTDPRVGAGAEPAGGKLATAAATASAEPA